VEEERRWSGEVCIIYTCAQTLNSSPSSALVCVVLGVLAFQSVIAWVTMITDSLATVSTNHKRLICLKCVIYTMMGVFVLISFSVCFCF
jgi:hypothetical protein